MTGPDDTDITLTTSEVAALYGVTDRTIRRWATTGRLPHTWTRLGSGTAYRTYQLSDIEDLRP